MIQFEERHRKKERRKEEKRKEEGKINEEIEQIKAYEAISKPKHPVNPARIMRSIVKYLPTYLSH